MPALSMDIPEEIFWDSTPKTLQPYFKAYRRKRITLTQDIWAIGARVREAIISSISFGGTPPKYSPMPYSEEENENRLNNKEWVERERAKTYAHFMALYQSSKRR